ncbi:MAG: response regulator [Bacteroidota bacterium]
MRNHKILMIVEDDADDRLYFSDAVKEIDAANECIEAWNGVQALKLLHKLTQLPDFIFIDINMPLMNGLDCLEKLKEDEKLKNIPVIIYTTSQYQENSDYTRELGAAYFITKPIDTKQLPQLIISAMEKATQNKHHQ